MTDTNHNAEEEKVTRLLGALAPDPHDRPDPRRALRQFKSRIDGETERRDLPMSGLHLPTKTKRFLAAGFGVVALVGLLAIPQVQAFASEFLSVFRVQKFVLVGVTQERMDQIKAAVGQDSTYVSHETLKDGGKPKTAATVAQAAKLAHFQPLTPDASYGDPTEIEVSGATAERFRPNAKELRSLFSTLNLDPNLIPEKVDGQPFDVSVNSGILQVFGSDSDKISLAQAPAPTVKVPDGVNMEQLGEAMFQLFGMSPAEAAHMSKSIDWTTTLVVPMPSDLSSMREVTVRNSSGLLFDGTQTKKGADSSKGEYTYTATLMWQENGSLFVVNGPSVEAVTSFADSLH